MYICLVTALLQSTNYPYNLNPYQIYSYAMSCRYNSIPAFFSQIQLTTEASMCHILCKTLQPCCDVKYCSKIPTLYRTFTKWMPFSRSHTWELIRKFAFSYCLIHTNGLFAVTVSYIQMVCFAVSLTHINGLFAVSLTHMNGLSAVTVSHIWMVCLRLVSHIWMVCVWLQSHTHDLFCSTTQHTRTKNKYMFVPNTLKTKLKTTVHKTSISR